MAVEIRDALWVADPDADGYPHAPVTPLLDLNPVGCDTSAYGFVLMDVPSPSLRADRRSVALGSVSRDGDYVAASSHGNAILRFSLGYKGDPSGDITQVVADARSLAAAMSRSGVLAWKIHGESDPLFYDFYPSQIAHYLTGQSRGLYTLARKLMDPNGMLIELEAYPWPRRARVDGVAVDLSNDLSDGDLLVSNGGNRYGETRTRITPSSGTVFGWLAAGIRSKGDLDAFRAWYDRSADTWVPKKDTIPDGIDGSTGLEAFVTDYATETMERRFRDIRTPTDPTGVEGTFRAFVRCKAVYGDVGTGLFNVRLAHGFATSEVVQETGRKLEMDWRNVATRDWIWFDLGLVQIPEGVGQTVFDLYSERLEGTEQMAWDRLAFVPADEYYSQGGVPGFLMGRWGRRGFDADELDGTGHLRQGTYRLNADGEVAHTPSLALAPGIYEARVHANLLEPDDDAITDGYNPTSKELGRLRAIADPAGAADVRAGLVLRNQKNRKITERHKSLYFLVTQADVDDFGGVFRIEVEQTADELAGRAIRIQHLRLSFMLGITHDDTLVLDNHTDPLRRRSYVESDAVTAFPFVLENEMPWAPPGDSAWVFLWGDLPTDQGFRDIDERGPVPVATLGRTCSVRVDVTERESH